MKPILFPTDFSNNASVEEGTSISADRIIVYSNDFSVVESIRKGESFAEEKDKNQKDKFIFQGTAVAMGLAIATITAIRSETKLGKSGKSLQRIIKALPFIP